MPRSSSPRNYESSFDCLFSPKFCSVAPRAVAVVTRNFVRYLIGDNVASLSSYKCCLVFLKYIAVVKQSNYKWHYYCLRKAFSRYYIPGLQKGISEMWWLLYLGYMLIAGRCRREDECQIVRDVIEKNFKKRLNIEKIYDGKSLSSMEFSSKVCSISVIIF